MLERICTTCGATVRAERFRRPAEVTRCRSCRCRAIALARSPETFDWIRGEGNPQWKGGVAHSWGYVYLLRPEHPRANHHGYVKRADLVLEETLGRPLLPGEFAHHRNEDKGDDRPDNLEATTRSPHQRHHNATRRPKDPPSRPA
jgi:hypothetical protein